MLKAGDHMEPTPADHPLGYDGPTPVSRRTVVQAHLRFASIAGHLQSLALLILRIGIGFSLWFSGYSHLTHFNDMVERFTQWGVPMPHLSVWVSGITEAAGGILIVAGLGTRYIAELLFINFCVAYATQGRGELKQLFNGPDRWSAWGDLLDNAAMPYLVSSLVLIAFGPGKISIDYVLSRIFARQRTVASTTAAVRPPQT